MEGVPVYFTNGMSPLEERDFHAIKGSGRELADLRAHGVEAINFDHIITDEHTCWVTATLSAKLFDKILTWGADITYPGWAAAGDVPWVARNRPMAIGNGHRALWHRMPNGQWIGIAPSDVEDASKANQEETDG